MADKHYTQCTLALLLFCLGLHPLKLWLEPSHTCASAALQAPVASVGAAGKPPSGALREPSPPLAAQGPQPLKRCEAEGMGKAFWLPLRCTDPRLLVAHEVPAVQVAWVWEVSVWGVIGWEKEILKCVEVNGCWASQTCRSSA